MKYSVTTPPEGLPIEFADMQKHLRIDARDRTYVEQLIRQATAYAERMLDQSLMARTITAVYDIGDDLVLPRGPVIQIVSVTNAAGSVVYTQHRVGNSDRISITSASATPITVIYRAGYENAADIPQDIVGAIRLHTATLYSWREDLSPVSATPTYNLDRFYSFASSNTGIG